MKMSDEEYLEKYQKIYGNLTEEEKIEALKEYHNPISDEEYLEKYQKAYGILSEEEKVEILKNYAIIIIEKGTRLFQKYTFLSIPLGILPLAEGNFNS